MKRFFRTRRSKWLLLTAAVVLLILLQWMNALPFVGSAFTAIFKPVQSTFVSTAHSIKGGLLHFGDVDELRDEISNLSENNTRLSAKNLRLQKLIDDTKILSQELSFITEQNYNSTTAKVIGKSSEQYFQMIILNRGKSDGIQPGYPVFVNDGILIGKVWQASGSISKVLLLSNNHSEISATVQNDERSQGIIVGQYGITLKMELIQHDHSIAKDQLVVTSGIEEDVPEGLIIGRISEISKRAGELFQEATIDPLVDFNKLRVVTVILPSYD